MTEQHYPRQTPGTADGAPDTFAIYESISRKPAHRLKVAGSAPKIAVIGGGLAGCECALVLADSGIEVTIFEMKPKRFSPAHCSKDLAELVCSNSFRSAAPDSAVGILKEEMRALGSICLEAAEAASVPAGKALAVDREVFSAAVTKIIETHARITLVRKEITSLDPAVCPDIAGFDALVVAAGPLASDALADCLAGLTGKEHLYFYDAIAPVIDSAGVDMSVAFWGTRYAPEEKDYLNCPMEKDEYFAFYQALLDGEKVLPREFEGLLEQEQHFEGCMPIEALAERGPKTLVFGPLKPVGFVDPRTGKRPYALLQLRAENANKTMFNLVGCQTKLTFKEQERIFKMIPGLQNVEFVRFGSMHRNTFVNSPQALSSDGSFLSAPHIYPAGQITGVEGYVESAASGLMAGLRLAAKYAGKTLPDLPEDTAIGCLLMHLRRPAKRFQPSNVQFGLMPELGVKAKKANRKELYAQRAKDAFSQWMKGLE